MAQAVEKANSRKKKNPEFSKETYLKWYEMMLRIRRFEERTLMAYGQQTIGAGIGFAEKYRGTDNLCVTMFGDGAARQGALYEAFNMSMTWKLPVLYICENNQYAMGTSVERTSNVHDIYKVGSAFDMPSEEVDGMRPEEVHRALTRAAEHIRSGKGPYFLEIKTYRYKGHSVSDPAKYRTKAELQEYKDQDPVKMTT